MPLSEQCASKALKKKCSDVIAVKRTRTQRIGHFLKDYNETGIADLPRIATMTTETTQKDANAQTLQPLMKTYQISTSAPLSFDHEERQELRQLGLPVVSNTTGSWLNF